MTPEDAERLAQIREKAVSWSGGNVYDIQLLLRLLDEAQADNAELRVRLIQWEQRAYGAEDALDSCQEGVALECDPLRAQLAAARAAVLAWENHDKYQGFELLEQARRLTALAWEGGG